MRNWVADTQWEQGRLYMEPSTLPYSVVKVNENYETNRRKNKILEDSDLSYPVGMTQTRPFRPGLGHPNGIRTLTT